MANCSPSTVVVSNETEGIFAINVSVKVAGVDLSALSSEGKVFNVNGREYPMSRFGSWAFQNNDSILQARQVCVDGGITPSLTYGFLQICPNVDVWVKDILGYGFTLQMKDIHKKSMLEQISVGSLAKDLEKSLRENIPSIYRSVRIRLIRIMAGSTKTRIRNDVPEPKEFLSRFSTLRELECIANLMKTENYGVAYIELKKLIETVISDSERLQMLFRLGICCFHLTKIDEVKRTSERILRILPCVEEYPSSIDMFHNDVATFADQLQSAGMYSCALDILLACRGIVRKIDDPNDIGTKILENIMLCCSILHNALLTKPMVRMRMEFRKHLRELEAEVDYLRSLTDCDKLGQARNVYYALFVLNRIKAELGEPTSTVDPTVSMARFSCVESSWADFTRVMELAHKVPEIALMFTDLSLMKTVREICDNPLLLEKRILDPRIAKINALLNKGLQSATSMSGFTGSGLGDDMICDFCEELMKERSRPIDKKKEAANEKELGNVAYKQKKYKEALDHYDKAIELDPSDALLHNNKAAVFISKNELHKAKQSCLTAIRVVQSNDNSDSKDVAKITARLARVEFLSRRYDAAMALYQKSLRMHDDTKVRQQMSECEDAVLSGVFMDFGAFR